MEELDKKVSEIVRSTVKEFMESLMKGEIQAFLEENSGSRNGYYERDIGTRYVKCFSHLWTKTKLIMIHAVPCLINGSKQGIHT